VIDAIKQQDELEFSTSVSSQLISKPSPYATPSGTLVQLKSRLQAGWQPG
jgi:hypothetical protein